MTIDNLLSSLDAARSSREKPQMSTTITESPIIDRFAYRVVKRAVDIAVSGLGLMALFPFLLVVGLLVKMTSSGPILYAWNVVGRGGRPFRGYKFRTMVINADELKKGLEKLNERKGPTFKMERDPRVTPVGRILRKFSLDELPQLWSVLKGDMSLVGPRPVGPHEWERFEDWQRHKLSVTPGCISPWHVWGRSKKFEEWMQLELEYVDHWSLWMDIRILFGGVWYVLSGKNC